VIRSPLGSRGFTDEFLPDEFFSTAVGRQRPLAGPRTDAAVNRARRALIVAPGALLLTYLAFICASSVEAKAPSVNAQNEWTRFFSGKATSGLYGIVAGSDGHYLWATDNAEHALLRIGLNRSTMRFPIAYDHRRVNPLFLTIGANKRIYFSNTLAYECPCVGVADSFGRAAFYKASFNNPFGLALGSDGNVWFTEESGSTPGAVGRITQAGNITEWQTTADGAIANGPDGRIWFTDFYRHNRVGAITTINGAITWYNIPAPGSCGGQLGGSIAAGADGNIYATCGNTGWFEQITTTGKFTPLLAPGRPLPLAQGALGKPLADLLSIAAVKYPGIRSVLNWYSSSPNSLTTYASPYGDALRTSAIFDTVHKKDAHSLTEGSD
jgi:hypothetical protein